MHFSPIKSYIQLLLLGYVCSNSVCCIWSSVWVIWLYSFNVTFSLPNNSTILSNSSIIFLYICPYSSLSTSIDDSFLSQSSPAMNSYKALVMASTFPSASLISLWRTSIGVMTSRLNLLRSPRSVSSLPVLNFLIHSLKIQLLI